MKKIFFLIIAMLVLLPISFTQAADKDIEVHVFSQTGCPYCAKTISFLEELKESTYPNLNVHEYDLRNDPSQYQSFTNYQKAFGSFADGVPVTYINNKMINGYIPEQIEKAIKDCNEGECQNPEDIVKEYVKNNPDQETQADTNKTIMGWVVIGAIVIGAGVLFLSRK